MSQTTKIHYILSYLSNQDKIKDALITRKESNLPWCRRAHFCSNSRLSGRSMILVNAWSPKARCSRSVGAHELNSNPDRDERVTQNSTGARASP